MSGTVAKIACGLSATLLLGCGERAVVQEDPIIKRLGPPDGILYGFSEGDSEPVIFSNKGGFSRWALYNYEVDGWLIQVMTKDKRVVRVTSDNIKESEERARQHGDELRKKLSP